MTNIIILADAPDWVQEPRNICHWQRVVLWAQLRSHLSEKAAVRWMRKPNPGLDGRALHSALPEEVVARCSFPSRRRRVPS
jgi:hypothetical protein